MEDRLDSERLRGFCNRQTDRWTDRQTDRWIFAILKSLLLLRKKSRENFVCAIVQSFLGRLEHSIYQEMTEL